MLIIPELSQLLKDNLIEKVKLKEFLVRKAQDQILAYFYKKNKKDLFFRIKQIYFKEKTA